MIIPCIDLQGGSTVQLVEGRERALDAGDPLPLLRRFGRVGEVAVVDLDAALGDGSNEALVTELCRAGDVRVGGGIRDVETARRWLDRGATKVVLGTAARPEVLRELPRDRVIAALDARDGEVVVEGWTKPTGRSILERVRELRDMVGGFLVTFVEREGHMGGTRLDLAAEIVEAAGDAKVTIAGGVTSTSEIAALDSLGADAQVGMAIYSGKLALSDAFAAPLRSERADGLVPTVVVDESERALGLAWSSPRSLAHAIEHGVGAYESRRRGLWVKGATSGATQQLVRIEADCDRDALRFVVRQGGTGFCHTGDRTCWGATSPLAALERTVRERVESAPEGSYTRRLLDDPKLLEAKLVEEAAELGEARGPEAVTHEAADVLYFAMTAMARAGVDFAAVEAELERRSRRVSRRAGDAKVAR